MRKDIDNKRDYIIKQLTEGRPRFELCRELGCKYETLRSRLVKWGCDHLKNPSRSGISRPSEWKHVTEYLGVTATYISSHRLKLKLIRDGLKEHRCEVCGLSEWQGKQISLELDHLNGDRFDSRLENLMIKCPNCHSQADTNSGKNIGKYSK